MGYTRRAGRVSEDRVGGLAGLRLDIFVGDDTEPRATQFYPNASAFYCITPAEEKLCRQFTARCIPQPVTRYELPSSIDAQCAGADDDDEFEPYD